MAGNTPIKEKIDGRILRMLNLEDIFDIDYDTYFTLIKEKLVEANIRTKKIPVEEVMLLQQELKRIKQKIKKGGRFKPEKKKMSLSGIKTLKFDQVKKSNLSLPRTLSTPNNKSSTFANNQKSADNAGNTGNIGKRNESDNNTYKSIINSLDNITEILSNQFKFEWKNAETQRKVNEREKRKSKEDKLENSFSKGIEVLSKVAGKVFSPLQDFFTEIVNFLTRLFLAKAVSKFIDWFSDPKNKSKVETLGKIIEKFWPTILAGLIFLNPLGKLVAKASVIIVKGVAKLSSVAIPAITKFIKARGLGGAIAKVGVAGAATVGLAAVANSRNNEETTSLSTNSKKDQEVPQETPQYRKGGKITTNTGQDIRGAGVDTQLIAARPGEVVINKETVDAVGADYFLGLNKQYGGSNANKPKLAKNVQTASGGGLVLPAFSNGGMVGANEKPTGGSAKIIEGAKSIIGMGRGVGDRCADTTRAALKAAGHPSAEKTTKIGDLDTPQGTKYSGRDWAASFGGTDMGQVITSKSAIRSGDIILWKADRDLGKNTNKGAISHVGIAADDGLKNQYDHNRKNGWHYRPHWHSSGGTSWFAGIRLPGSGGNVPESGDTPKKEPVGDVGDGRTDGSKESKEVEKKSGLTFSMLYGALTGKTNFISNGTTQPTTTGTTQPTTTGTTQPTTTGTTQPTTTGTTQPSDPNIIQASHPDTGSGWTIKGQKDASGRPIVFAKGAAEGFSAMMKASGGSVKGSDIASSKRSLAKNTAIKGATRSKHLYGVGMDIHGTSKEWIKKNGTKYGWKWAPYGGPRDHGGHFVFTGSAEGSGQSSTPKESAPKNEGQEQQTKKDGSTPKTSGGSISGTGVGKGVSIAKKLIGDLNIGPAAAAGIVGNLMLESNLQPDNVENGKGFKDGPINNIPPGTRRVGYGWGQWTNDRLERFRKFLKDRKADNRPATDDDNYAYLINELTTTEKIKGHWKGWQGKNIPEDDPKKAATWFMMNWERPGVPHEDKRHKYAVDIFSQIKGISAGTKSLENISSSVDSSSSSTPSTSSTSDSSKTETTKDKKGGLTFDMLYGALTGKVRFKSNSTTSSISTGTIGTTESTTTSGSTGTTASTAIPSSNIKGSEIDKMSISQLRTMLDPTKPGASNEVVFNAAKQARQKAISEGLPKEEVERRALVASVKAKQGISPSSAGNANFISKSGPIKENTGIPVPGGGADRRIITTPSGQTIRSQPGEYMLTAASVTKLGGVEKLNQLLANLDKSSNPAKMGTITKDISQGIQPYQASQSGKVDIQTLPIGGVGTKMIPTSNNGSEFSFHSPVSQEGLSERQRILDTIGVTAFA